MKIRTGFVSNSSSSSFVVNSNEPSELVKEHYMKIEDESIKARIKELADFDIDDTKEIWYSTFYRDGIIEHDFENHKTIYAEGEELLETSYWSPCYPDEEYWKYLDDEKKFALPKTDDEKLEYIMSKYPTIEEFRSWVNGAKKYLNNELSTDETKDFIKLDDKIHNMFMFLIDQYSEDEVSYNDIDYITSSKMFLTVLAPLMEDIVSSVRKEITKKVLNGDYDF